MEAPRAPAEPRVAVWQHARVESWHGIGDDDADAFPVEDLIDALSTCYAFDAHAVGYRVHEPDGLSTVQPRVKIDALRSLAEHGIALRQHVVLVDFDREDHVAWSATADSEDFMIRLFERFGDAELEAAFGYTTRAGFRLGWVLSEPLPIAVFKSWAGHPPEPNGNPPKPGAGFLKWLHDAIKPEIDTWADRPFVLDRISNEWSRCFRLPLVVRDGKPTEAYVDVAALEADLRLDVAPWLDLSATAEIIVPRDVFEGDAPVGDDLDAWLLGPEDWTATGLSEALRHRWPGLYKALKAGRVFFKRGERNQTTFEAICLIAELLKCTEPRELYAIFHGPTVKAVEAGTSRTPLSEALGDLWDQCCRRAAHEAARKEAEHAAKAEAERKRALLIASSHVEGPEGGMLPPLLFHDSTYYVLDAREIDGDGPPGSGLGLRYFPPTKNTQALRALLTKGCGDLDLHLFNEKGGFRQLPGLLAQYGYQIDRVILSLSARTPSIEGTTLRLPAAPRPHVEPVQHDDVDAWLRLLGGDDAEGLLDWLATCSILERPTSALYLQGAGGTGKGMLAGALGAMWGAAPVSLSEATARFNSSIAHCPVVFLDEKIVPATAAQAEGLSASFRSLVAETTRRVEAKGRPTASLEGAVRVIIAANNADALPLTGAHTSEDIEAVAQRIRHFHVDPRAADLLGWERTAEWVRTRERKPGKIAQHVEYLHHTRSVDVGGRFLVPGVRRDYHEALALTSHRLDALAAVALAVAKGSQAASKAGVLMRDPESGAGPRRLLVNVGELRRQWSTLTGDHRVPGQGTITGALSALDGVKKTRWRGLRYYVVPHRHLLRAATKLQISTEYVLRKHLGLSTEGLEEDPVEADRLADLMPGARAT